MISRDRSSVAISSLVLHTYLHSVALEPHFVCFDGLERRQLDRRARAHVEARAVPRALDLIPFQLALIQRAAIVGTQVVDGIELPADVAHRHLVVADLKDRYALGRDVRGFGHRLPGRHRLDEPSVIADQTASSSAGSWSFCSVEWKNPSTISCSASARSSPRLCK